MKQIHIIDSHTGGEPTRLVVDGGPDLGTGTLAERLHILRERHDWLRRALVNEPRGNDVIVGALLCPPTNSTCATGVIFFNNVGYLGMCGHGTIGLMASLSYLGRVQPSTYRIETPVGVVSATLHTSADSIGRESRPSFAVGKTKLFEDGQWLSQSGAGKLEPYPNLVSVRNVPSYRHAKNVSVQVDGIGRITGDVAWGGNWFFLINDHGQTLRMSNIATLTRFTSRVKDSLARETITGANGAEIDHIELFGPSLQADSRSFVLCPGAAYDRSPCGTGTSAKLACLHADGKLAPGQVWRQESIVGSVFEGRIEVEGEHIIPTITGEACVTADATLLLDPRDPFRNGIAT